MNWARQQNADDLDTLIASTSRRRQGSSLLVFIALLASAMAAGLGYYALKLAGEQRMTRATLQERGEAHDALRQKHAAAVAQNAALVKERDERDALLKEANEKLLELNTQLAAAETRLAEYQEERSELDEQLQEFRAMTKQFQRMIDSGRLKVTFRRGRMIVEMPSQVLFPSGSAELTDDGRKALAEVAKILRGMPNRRFSVAGHTDTVKVNNEQFANNWELSSARAVGVTLALIKGGLRPEQLVAAGYGEYDPVASNATEAGRQKNRRIEIILEPRLAPLPGLAKSGKEAADKAQKKDKGKDEKASARARPAAKS